jgi:anti-sigma B factor antagonist
MTLPGPRSRPAPGHKRVITSESVHRISLDRDRAATVVTASGELDAFVAGELEAAFGDASQEPSILVDLTAVSFMDSTALGLLVRAVRDVEGRGGAIRVVLPSGTARRIFELTTLDRVLPVAGSRSDALAELD